MTDKYTLEEIEAVIVEYGTDEDWAYIRDALTLPKHNFREGEVVFFGDRYMQFGRYDYYRTSKQPWKPARRLRLSEMPQAVEDLRRALLDISGLNDYPDSAVIYARKALAKFDAEIEK